ncbi:MAG: ERCC4 domain-containing protein [Candidatus Micrarchaeota archaeon]
MASSFLKPGLIEPRQYQEILAYTVLDKGNTLIVAPTALGKTVVAALVINQRLADFSTQKVLMLSPTKPLALQHQATFQKFFDIPSDQIELLTGSSPPAKREAAWQRACIISATPQAIENDIISGRLSLKDFSLVIFDEAHRAVGDYSYVFLAKRYLKQAVNPLILGLTASPGSEQEKIQDVCKNLFIENIEIKTLKDADVQAYANPIELEWQKVDLSPDFLQIKAWLRDFQKDQLLFIKKLGLAKNIQSNMMRRKDLLMLQVSIRHNLVERAKSNPALWTAISKLAALLKISHAEILLETQGIVPLHDYFERLQAKSGQSGSPKALQTVLSDARIQKAMQATQHLFENGETHPKQKLLTDILQSQFKQNQKSKVIVFNHYRDSVKHLTSVLEKIEGVRPIRFVGQATKGEDKGLTQKQQGEFLEHFRNGEYNTLVASSVHPEEFIIVRNDAENKIEIKKIGDFVDAYIPFEPVKSEVVKISGYSSLSFDNAKTVFLPITHVHKHPRKSEVVETVFSSGFRAKVTRDHSFFTFDASSNLVPSPPKENLFAKICLTAPNIEENQTLDLAKEFDKKLPPEMKKKVLCTISGLTQARIRELTSNKKFLNTLLSKSRNLTKIADESGLDKKTVNLAGKRLAAESFVLTDKTGKFLFFSLTKPGREYYKFLQWFFKNCRYRKKKYRVSLEAVAKTELKLETFCQIFIEASYGKTKFPRFLEVNPSLAEFLGLYVAEGNARNTTSTAGIHLAAQKKEMQERMAASVRKGLGIDPSITWRGIDIHSKLAYYLIKYVFRAGIGAYNKEIPSIIFTLPTEHKWKFLEGYARGDGHLTDKRIVLTTVSQKLVTGLIFLLRQLGIKKITLQKNAKRTPFNVCIMESVPFQEINVHGKKCYYDLVPVAQTDQRTFALMQNTFLSQNKGQKTREVETVTEQNCFDYIKKIAQLKVQPKFVYDISVDKTQLFVGGQGLICLHNSVAEEGLDIPQVDLVIFFEPVPSEIRTIQRRGRTGRLDKGRCIVLMAAKTRDEAYYYSSMAKERLMYRTLKKMQKRPEINLPKPNKAAGAQKQTLLSKYVEELKDKVEIFVDSREQASSVCRELTELGAVIRVKQLEVSDYVLGPEIAVERKTVEDFLESLIDGRLFNQLQSLSQTYSSPLIILEGNPRELFSLRNIHKNAIWGSLSSIAINYRIPILFSENSRETAEVLFVIAKREQLGKDKDLRIRTGRKGLTLTQSQQFVVESLPMVGPTMAKSLLDHFKTIKSLVNATEKELKEVNNMGEKKAKKIVKLINAKYEAHPQNKFQKETKEESPAEETEEFEETEAEDTEENEEIEETE